MANCIQTADAILNQQFCPVFTDEYTTNMPKLEGPPTTDMDKIEIPESGL